MVQVIQPRDIFEEIGKSTGGGVSEALNLFTQKRLTKRAMDEATKDPNQSPTDLFKNMSVALSGVPGGMQLLGDAYPLLREENIREAKKNDLSSRKNAPKTDAQPVGGGQEPTSQTQSVEERVKNLTLENVDAGMLFDKAQASAQQTIGLETAQQQQVQQEQQFASQTFDKNIGESFPDGQLDSALIPSMRQKYEKSVGDGLSPSAAWAPIAKEYRAAQVEIGKLGELPGRTLFGDTGDVINQSRQTIPKLIQIDPELARSQLQEKLDLGEAEASQVVRPGNKAYKNFVASSKKARQEGFTKAYDQKGFALENRTAKELEKLSARQNKSLEKFLKERFDPKADSLLALRGEMSDTGVNSEDFLKAAQSAFPGGAEDENLSDFNRNEFSRLSQPIKPGMAEIFRGIFKGVAEPARRTVSEFTRGKK